MTVRAAGTRVVLAAPGVPAEILEEWCRGCADWFPARAAPAGAPSSPGVSVAHVSSRLGPLLVRREAPAGWRRALLAAHARRLSAPRAFRAGRALLRCGLATPEPLAVLVRRRAPAPGASPGASLGTAREALLVTRRVDGLGPWAYLQQGQAPDALVTALAPALARLHAAGFRHRDLQAANLLLHAPEATPTAAPQVVWTQLDGIRHLGTLPLFLRARDLGRLALSFESPAARAAGVRADHWPALLRAYLERFEGREPSALEQGDLLARTARWSARAIRRHLARGRPIE